MTNLTGRPVTPKGQKRKRCRKPTVSHLAPLIARAKTKGPERQYLDWLKTQPSALTGHFSYDDGNPFCEPAHWRTATHAGTSQKPEYLAIPLTNAEHALQHQTGQSVIGTREWWEEQVRLYLRLWLTTES